MAEYILQLFRQKSVLTVLNPSLHSNKVANEDVGIPVVKITRASTVLLCKQITGQYISRGRVWGYGTFYWHSSGSDV